MQQHLYITVLSIAKVLRTKNVERKGKKNDSYIFGVIFIHNLPARLSLATLSA